MAKASIIFIALLVMSQITHAEEKSLSDLIRDAHTAGKLDGLHSVILYRDGKVLAEVYLEGRDERWGTPLGVRQHGPETLHDLRSVTKSIVGLLYGIALEEGIVPDPSKKLIDQFPAYADLKGKDARDTVTIGDVLTMQMGLEWNEDLPYSDPRNSEIAMEHAKDRTRFILSRKMVEEPGSKWRYSGGATSLLGHLISKGAGKPLEDYAREKLFTPLGIEKFEWVYGPSGKTSAASGLRLTVRDLAKIGQLVLDNGRHKGIQLVPNSWISELRTPRTAVGKTLRYSYQWYLFPGSGTPYWIAGFGNGGQRVSVSFRQRTVLALFAGNYNKRDAWKMPVRLIEEILAPALLRQ